MSLRGSLRETKQSQDGGDCYPTLREPLWGTGTHKGERFARNDGYFNGHHVTQSSRINGSSRAYLLDVYLWLA